MPKNSTKSDAETIVKSLFAGTDVGELSRDDLLKKVRESTLYNYVSLLKKYGLAEAVKDDPKDRRKTSSLKLTDRGAQVLARSQPKSAKPVVMDNFIGTDLGYTKLKAPQKSLHDLFELADVLETQDPKLSIKIYATRED